MIEKNILKRLTKIVNDIENQDIETVTELLNHYCENPIEEEGMIYNPFTEPRLAARINARYNELTGKNHPVFLKHQAQVIDELLANKDELISVGAYTPMYFETLEQLKGNLTNDTPTMEVVNGSSKHVLGRMSNIVNDLENANLEDVSELLNYYNGKPVLIDGVSYHPYNDPRLAARINARYNELTGEDHPIFLQEQGKVIDELLANKEQLLKAGVYTPMYFDTLEQLKGNLTNDTPTMEVVNGSSKHVLGRMSSIVNDLENAQLEDVSELLKYYNGKSVLIDGVSYHPYNDPRLAARINARYKELTGEDHPTFLQEQGKVIDGLLANKEQLIRAGVYTPMYFETLEQLKGNLTNETPTMEVANGYSKHILGRMSSIVNDLGNAQLEDVCELLKYYNGKTVLIDGISYHPYNDPKLATKINARYKELTGEDHPTFLQEQGKVIDRLFAEKEHLIEIGVYSSEYFDELEQLRVREDRKVQQQEGKGKIELEEIRDVVKGIKISDINAEYDAIKSQTQQLAKENDNLSK